MKRIRSKQPRKRGDAVFPIITLWELSVARKPEFWSDLAQNLMQAFSHPNDASDKIWLQSPPLILEIFMFEIVNRRTDGRQLKSHPKSSPCEPLAQVS